jgi:hypothetical protein
MKVFAILTACLMAAGGATYYISSEGCPFSSNCPVAKTGGCSATVAPCCATPCPACSTDCLECCAVCEQCCEAGATVPAIATASVKTNCCSAVEVCCETSASCCSDKASPVNIATSAVVAGVTLK